MPYPQHIAAQLQARGIEASIAAMVGRGQSRDPFTAGHEERVAVLAAAMARRLGLDDEEVRAIYLASLVHDVGKLDLPIELLNKPGPLTTLEYELVKTHVEASYRIARQLGAPAPFAEIVRQHHERLDGSGYPRGLRGDEMLLGARILAIADVPKR
jgi:putative nucleotidyltransferase with HDIG domain